MATRFLYALPLSVLFMTISDQWAIDGFIVGYVMGVAVMFMVGDVPGPVRWARLPIKLAWLVVYIARLTLEIFLSSFDVARRVLDPRLPINPGEVVVSTQDKTQSRIISALSAHAVTVTPGEMVIGFKEEDGETFMIVHTLDIDTSRESVDEAQASRLALLRRTMGDDD